ncbi:MAG: pyridoxal-dependent decarboxylase [Chloroflexota bacterium]|nr:pyridoxal-dependent decarboxylase [Chloroflexota bacterium]
MIQIATDIANASQVEGASALERAYQISLTYLAGLTDRTVSERISPAAMAELLDEPLPEDGLDPASAVQEWYTRAERGIVASSGPRFFGFVTGGSTPAAVAGDWLASAIDQNAGMWLLSPAAAQTELVVLRWLKELFGLPAAWAGVLTSGGTMANLVGLASARQWAGQRLGFDAAQNGLADHPAIPVLASTEIHASALKALGVLGIGRGSVRQLPAPGGVLDLAAFDDALESINGPVIAIANAGDVNTGAFDPIEAMADRCAAHPGGAWLHVDGAFGLFAAASPAFAYLTTGVERASSVAADGHKWLNVPYDSGFAFVRDHASLRDSFVTGGAYLASGPEAGWDAVHHCPEMSRRFRGLAAWCALKAFGRAGYQEMIERCAANAAQLASWVEATPGLELMAPAPLIIVCFRLAPEGLDADAADAINREAVAALQRDGRAFVSETVWRGRAAIRAAFDNWSTTPADVAILQTAVTDVIARLVGSDVAPD